jgi:hypothetical protein
MTQGTPVWAHSASLLRHAANRKFHSQLTTPGQCAFPELQRLEMRIGDLRQLRVALGDCRNLSLFGS